MARMAAAIGEPARARMLYCLMDDRARTSTELAVIAEVGASTASAHLNRLVAEGLVQVKAQGKCKYYRLSGERVARVLEQLSVLAGSARAKFVPNTPERLREARTCYDHMAGTLGVAIHDRMRELGWLQGKEEAYEVTASGMEALSAIGMNAEAARGMRRRFAFGCLDWSERRSHLGGALGAALLETAIGRGWVVRELDSRALTVTRVGRREMAGRFGIGLEANPRLA